MSPVAWFHYSTPQAFMSKLTPFAMFVDFQTNYSKIKILNQSTIYDLITFQEMEGIEDKKPKWQHKVITEEKFNNICHCLEHFPHKSLGHL